MKKKILALITALILVVSAVPFTVSAATSDFKVSVSDAVADAAGKAVVTVDFAKNTGVAVAFFNITFDKEALVLEEVIASDIFDTVNSDFDVDTGVTVMCETSDLSNATDNGTVLTLYFDVVDMTAVGNHKVNISYSEFDFCDENLDDVAPNIEGGGVMVTEENAADARFTYEGAQIRTEGTQALRFIFSVEEEFYNTLTKPTSKADVDEGFGVVLFVANDFNGTKLVKGTEGTDYKSVIVPAVNIYDIKGGKVYFTACITDISASAYADIEYVAIPYATTGDTTVYGRQTSNTSVYDVALKVVADENADAAVKEYVQTNIIDVVEG